MSLSTVYTVGVNITGSGVGLARAAQAARRDMALLGKTVTADVQKMAKARELLGVRSEREVQREIQRTQAAYNRLARSGQLSWNEQRRAARAMREEVRSLNNEMGRFTVGQRAMRGLQMGGMVAAGATAAGAVVVPKVREAMAYDLRLAHLSNTAFAGQSLSARQAGMRGIDQAVIEAVRRGGGTREGALDTYELLSGSGRFKPAEIRQILRESVLAATATGGEAGSFAQMAIAANATMGIGAAGVGRLFGMGTYAGQQGGFEIRDMAKWLPSQMAMARQVGLYGEGGFAKLAALNQAAVNTAGTRDEAGNNVVNLLAKIGSMDTAKDFAKLGIDLPKRLAEGKMAGMDALDVVGNILQQQLSKSGNYQALQQQLAQAKDGSERQAALRSVGDIAQGTVVGKVFQDRQAMLALLAFMNERQRVSGIAGGAMANPGAHLANMDLISSTAAFQTSQMGQEKAIALQSAMDTLTPTVGTLAERVTGLMREYPGYTSAVVGATTALTALAAAAGAAGIASLAMGGGRGVGGLVSGAGRVAGVAGRAGLVGLAGAAGYGVGSVINKGIEGTAVHNGIGRVVAKTLAFFGNQEAADAVRAEGALEKVFKRAEVKGEVTVRITTAPGVGADAAVMFSNPRIPLRADVGRTGLAAGH